MHSWEDSEDDRTEFYETICADALQSAANFGRDKGVNPSPTEAQQQEVEKLHAKIVFKHDSTDDDDFYDILNKPRVLLFESKVLKRYHNSKQPRVLYLLNDLLLVTSLVNSGTFTTKEKIHVHTVFHLDQISFMDLIDVNSDENRCAFQIESGHHKDRVFQFIAESENDKHIWLQEIEAATFAVLQTSGVNLLPGWREEVKKGTLHSAAFYGDMKLLSAKVNGLDSLSIDSKNGGGMNSLHWAAYQGHYEAVELLLDNDANVNALNSGLNTPLMLACARGFDSVVFLLLERGADFTIRNSKDKDSLLMGVLYGHNTLGMTNIIRTLTRRDIAINKSDSSGSTPLHECASRGLSRPIEVLVDCGADVNMQHRRNGLTPLQVACSADKLDIETVRTFLNKGAHPNWKNASKNSAFDIVIASHSARMNKEKDLGSAVAASTIRTAALDEVQDFAVTVLPVLQEIVRKGGRYSEDRLVNMRQSLVEAINMCRVHWSSAQEPDYFISFVGARGLENIQSQMWVQNAKSKHCQLCLATFKMFSHRRHHCRICGQLCCEFCSSKRFSLPPSGSFSPSKAASSSSGSFTNMRVCDGCFNRLTYEASEREDKVQRARKVMEKEEKAEREEMQRHAVLDNTPGKSSDLNHSQDNSHHSADTSSSHSNSSSHSLFSPNDTRRGHSGDSKTPSPTSSSSKSRRKSSQDMSSGRSSSDKYSSSTIDSTKAKLTDAIDTMNLRGQELQSLKDRTEEMHDASGDFENISKKLLKQQKKHSSLFRVF